MEKKQKILIIRFSSFGDVIQSLSIPSALKDHFPQAEIHFVTRQEYTATLSHHPNIHRIWSLSKKEGLSGLIKLIKQLKQENYSHIYDAHNNLRSHVIHWLLNGPWGLWAKIQGRKFLRRPTYRWKRFLLFRFHINLYPKPYPGQLALLQPLTQWGISSEIPSVPQIFFSSQLIDSVTNKIQKVLNTQNPQLPLIALAPSASYKLKRWPPEHWKKLIQENPQWRFLLLGGSEDHFIQEIANTCPQRTINTAGKMSFEESSAVLSLCQALISNDTGLMHIAEQLGMKCIALMGPAPFGYPGRATTIIKERYLSCRPCSKHGQGPCTNSQYHQECLASINSVEVANSLKTLLK